MKIHVPAMDVSKSTICTLFISSFEGGSNHWLHGAELVDSDYTPTTDVVYYGQENFFAEGSMFRIKLTYDDPTRLQPNTGVMLVGPEDVERGLTLMAKNSPERFAEVINETDDSETADVFMQLMVFGEVVYG